jgi:hypothetical protein
MNGGVDVVGRKNSRFLRANFRFARRRHNSQVEAQGLFARATGNFAKTYSIPLMSADEFKAAMEKAKSVKSSYTAPTATKQ